MKIIHIGWYNPEPAGGVVKAIFEQTRNLHSMGHQVEIWSFSPEIEIPRRVECSAPFPVWEIPAHLAKFRRFFGLPTLTTQWIKKRLPEVDIFHIHSVFIPENNRIAALGKPTVLTPNGGWSKIVLNGKRKWFKRLWILTREAPMWKSALAIQAVSREEAKQLSQLRGIAPISYIPNGTQFPIAISSQENRYHYLYIGRLDIHQKGLDLLLEALRIVKERKEIIPKFFIAGPDYRGGKAFLEAFSARHELSEYIEILGTVHGERKEELFKKARLFVHTSRWEGLPLVLLEAVAYGVPCLLTRGTNVASEWVAAGCSFETGDNPSDIAKHLIQLAKKDLSIESQAARVLAEKEYNWEIIAKDLSELYSSLLNTSETIKP